MSPDRGAQKVAALTALPTGEVTFLFSDIEGSTQRWEAHPEAMKLAVARHEQIVSGAIERHCGHVFKLMGDAFCVAFQSAPDAIAAAIDAQRALAEEDFSSVDGLRVRMGLHTGNAEERNADYFGPTVNRVARLISIGHGGQVLLSGALANALRNAPPSDATLIDLGLRRLKDLAQPEQVWQLTIAGLPSDFPPLNSLDARANNLPIQTTSLFGRERDVEEVKLIAGQSRLLTLSGSGGVGKTRLALQAGADLLDRYPDGVWFADLAPISDPQLVASVIAGVVSMPQRGDQRLDEAIPQWLKRKHLLLILDNCEHVLETTASLAEAILAAAPLVRILATSRQALDVSGEVVLRLPSLAVPDASVDIRASDAERYGAIELFVDRARAADARFALTDDTAPVIADICRRLDGIPFAIELAAARVKVLSIPNLARRLDDRFKLLTGGRRTALPRQKTLGALIEWSYGLLTQQEQTLSNRAGIFAGGFSLNAAMSVCSGEGIDEADVLDLLASVTDKSLVAADTFGAQERYRLLESTRAYALEKLDAAGEREIVARRHFEYYLHLAQDADGSFGTGSTSAWLTGVEVEIDNFRAALEWALTDLHDVALGGALVGPLGWLWREGGIDVEGRRWIGRAQAGLDESAHPEIAARLWLGLANLHFGKKSYDCAERALELYQSVGDGRRAAWAQLRLGQSLVPMGRLEEASEMAQRAITGMRDHGDRAGTAACLRLQVLIHQNRGDIAAARELSAQALALYTALGNESGVSLVRRIQAELEFADGCPDVALRFAIEALEISMRSKDSLGKAVGHNNAAAYRIALGDMDGAREAAREGLRWARRMQESLLIAWSVQHLALIGALHDDARDAARLIGYVDAQYEVLRSSREPTEKWGYQKLMVTLRERLGDAEIERLAAEGAAWSEDRAIEEALSV